MKNFLNFRLFLKLILTAGTLFISFWAGFFLFIFAISEGLSIALSYLTWIIVPSLFLPLIWLKNKSKYLKYWLIFVVIFLIAIAINFGIIKYNESITINTAPNIDVYAYLPFKETSKIVKLDNASLQLTDNLPIVDGAAAVFPVYSAFVNAVYPSNVELYDDTFKYNNTVLGYKLLSEKETDIFFGAYPSEEQIEDAHSHGTNFEYTQIGSEAFVFFVHKDNPIDNLTTEQLQKIYAGEITNWKEVGGKNEKIAAFQRNNGSGSQSMLIRFMNGKKLMDPPSELRNDLMSGIIENVSNYKNKTNSIGFSFRYYVEGIIQNPDIKLLSIDGVAPTIENIQNGSYPVITPLYAVTYEDNDNENVDKLLNWILSEEGQEIIEKTGYAPLF